MAHNFDDIGEIKIGEVTPGARQVLPHHSNSRFLLRHHPLRWQFVCNEHTSGDGEWLPLLGQRAVSLGVNGTGSDGSQAHANEYDRDNGWQTIDYTCTQDGETYLRARECQGGLYHYTRWEQPRHVGREVMSSDIDTGGYYEWLRWLVAEGVIAPITRDAKRRCSQQQQHRVANVQRDLRSNPHLSAQLDDEKARHAAMMADDKPVRRRTKKVEE